MQDKFDILVDLVKVGVQAAQLTPEKSIQAVGFLTVAASSSNPAIRGEVDCYDQDPVSMATEYVAHYTKKVPLAPWTRAAQV